jgi:hypothetical protein
MPHVDSLLDEWLLINKWQGYHHIAEQIESLITNDDEKSSHNRN